MMVIISNVNPSSNSRARNSFSYTIADHGDESYKHLSNGVYVKLDAADPEQWSTQESVPTVVSDVLVFPNPFVSKGQNVLSFRLPPVANPDATLAIFSGTLDRIISRDLPVIEFHPSEPSITWDGHDDQNNLAPSGIYFYVITVDDKQYMGKFVIIRE